MKIFVDENIPMGLEAFQDHGEVVRFAGRSLVKTDLVDAQALIVRSITRINADLLAGTPIRFVATATIGTDHVDQGFLRDNGIGFTAAPGCNANSVGEYVSAALTHLEIEKDFSLSGKTLGIVGFGHVGKNLASKATALGLKVLKCDPPLSDLALQGQGDPAEFTKLADVLSQSDIISLHVPLVKAGPHPTLNLVNADFFSRLSHPIVLINTCRGEVIQEIALAHALKTGKIRNLVLDVFANEPNLNQSLVAAADIITPHIAGYSLQGKLNGTLQVANAFRQFFGFSSRWKPTHPGPSQPTILYPFEARSKQAEDAEFRRHCLKTAYDIMGDDRRLRDSFLNPHPGKAFDGLRRDYQVRHEFAGYKIMGVPMEKRELRFQLSQLGFQVI